MKFSDDLIAGAFSGVVARMISAPFDVLKIRSQLQVDKADIHKSLTVVQGFRQIIKEEGFFALWKGNLSATYLWITYAMVQFTVYGFLKRFGESILDKMNKPEHTNEKDPKSSHSKLAQTFVLFLAGAGAGIASTASTYPFDIMRTQFAVQGRSAMYPTIRSFVMNTYKTKGIFGFYAGLTPALVGITPYMGLNFAIYELMKMIVIPQKSSLSTLPSASSPPSFETKSTKKQSFKFQKQFDAILLLGEKFLCGGVAGAVSKFAVYPLDTVKKRLQAQVLYTSLDTISSMPKYNGIIDCITSIIRNEGTLGLYRGIVPTVLKSVVATSITFVSYEAAIDFLKALAISKESSTDSVKKEL